MYLLCVSNFNKLTCWENEYACCCQLLPAAACCRLLLPASACLLCLLPTCQQDGTGNSPALEAQQEEPATWSAHEKITSTPQEYTSTHMLHVNQVRQQNPARPLASRRVDPCDKGLSKLTKKTLLPAFHSPTTTRPAQLFYLPVQWVELRSCKPSKVAFHKPCKLYDNT